MNDDSLCGYLLLDKHEGVTSFQAVRLIRNLVGKRAYRVGHAGTLDLFASGLLVIGIGRQATKHINLIMRQDKTYVARGELGYLTGTYDNQGEVMQRRNCAHVTRPMLEKQIAALGDGYLQTPPIYSALWHEGRRFYKLAHSGSHTKDELAQIAKTKQRSVQIHDLALQKFSSPFFQISAHVSHGTYIRSLVNDLAQGCGSCATTVQLRRTAIGALRVEGAVTYDMLCANFHDLDIWHAQSFFKSIDDLFGANGERRRISL